jgi:hypothetical protein
MLIDPAAPPGQLQLLHLLNLPLLMTWVDTLVRGYSTSTDVASGSFPITTSHCSFLDCIPAAPPGQLQLLHLLNLPLLMSNINAARSIMSAIVVNQQT